VTGSTGYQILTEVPRNLLPAATYHIDAWRIATADGRPRVRPRPISRLGYGH